MLQLEAPHALLQISNNDEREVEAMDIAKPVDGM